MEPQPHRYSPRRRVHSKFSLTTKKAFASILVCVSTDSLRTAAASARDDERCSLIGDRRGPATAGAGTGITTAAITISAQRVTASRCVATNTICPHCDRKLITW
jgi:hypothetical protein